MNAANERPGWFLLSRHWVSLVGMGLLATAIISWLFVLPLQIRGHAENPYVGIIVFLILPAIFFLGLVLVPIGVYLSKRQIRQQLTDPGFDRKAVLRRIGVAFGCITILNILIGTQVTYRAVEHMETPQFCGATCHSMSPEFAAYKNAPHSRIECVSCHVAPGAGGWVDSKTNGIHQLVVTAFNKTPRPIPAALESNRLVPSKETCENCHWPNKLVGTRLRAFSKFAEDETNTRTETVMMMIVGGGKFSGIHGAHLGSGVHIRFAAADGGRQEIPWVEYSNPQTGESRTFVTSGSDSASIQNLPKYEMQCVDCHNRPTHAFEMPDRAMDKALAFGDISVTLPYIKKKAVELLKVDYPTSQDATDKLPKAIADFYQQNYPSLFARRSDDIRQAGQAVLAIYNRNVFPDMKVKWGTYPNNLGHTDFPGCFRCHDGSHEAPDGNAISQDCTTCHEPLATDEASPQILKTLGIEERMAKIRKQ